jgi:potassium efflux system protein
MSTAAKTHEIGDDERRWLKDGRKNLGFVAALEPGHLDDIISCMSLASYPAGVKVCVEGEAGDAFFIIYEGGVEVTKKGWDKPVGQLIPGEFFGEMSLLFQKPRSATVATTKATRLFALKASDFRRTLDANPDLADIVHAIAEARLRELARS